MKIADLFAVLAIKTDKASIRKADKVIAGVKTSLTRLVVASGAAVVGMAAMVRSTAAAADHYSKLSKKVGISVEGLQQLEFAANISGTNLASLRTGLQRFARTADDAGQGLKTAQEPFERLGVAFEDGEGNLRSQEELLSDMADAFAAMPAGTEKTALAMKSFGRAGAELIPLLDEGSAGIAKLREEFAETGAQISTADAQAFEEYNDTITRVKTALIGFRNQAVIALLPHLKQISKQVLAWVKANRGMIKQRLKMFMKALLVVLKVMAKTFVFMIKHVKLLTIAFLSWKAAIIGTAIATKIMAAGSVKAAALMAASWAKAALPLVLIAIIIGAIALLLEDLIAAFTGKNSVIGSMFEEVVKRWSDSLLEFFNWVEKKFESVALVADDFISFVTGKESKREKKNRAAVERFRKDPENRVNRLRREQEERNRPDTTPDYESNVFEPTFGPEAPAPAYTGAKAHDYGIYSSNRGNTTVNVNVDGGDTEKIKKVVQDAVQDEARSVNP